MAGDPHLCIVHALATKTMNNIQEQSSYFVSKADHILLCLYLLTGMDIIGAV